MNTVENLRLWFLTCPTVSNVLLLNADYIGTDTPECAIYSMPSTLKSYEDVCGNISYSGNQVLNFIFALHAPHGEDTEQNLQNIQFFADLKDWMYEQNTLKNFPEIEEGSVKSIMPMKSQYVASATAGSATYQMQCSIDYWRDE